MPTYMCLIVRARVEHARMPHSTVLPWRLHQVFEKTMRVPDEHVPESVNWNLKVTRDALSSDTEHTHDELHIAGCRQLFA